MHEFCITTNTNHHTTTHSLSTTTIVTQLQGKGKTITDCFFYEVPSVILLHTYLVYRSTCGAYSSYSKQYYTVMQHVSGTSICEYARVYILFVTLVRSSSSSTQRQAVRVVYTSSFVYAYIINSEVPVSSILTAVVVLIVVRGERR